MFIPVSARAAAAYRQMDIQGKMEGANPREQVNMLFDGLIQTIQSAHKAMLATDFEAKGRAIGKAVRIIEEGLKAGLNLSQGGELAANLHQLYQYCSLLLTRANLKNDPGLLDEAVNLLSPVAQAWKNMGTQAGPVVASEV